MAATKKPAPPSDPDPQAVEPDVSESPAATSDDTKDRYRQALEAKKSKPGYSGGSGQGGSGQGKGSSARAGGKREFRRKSG